MHNAIFYLELFEGTGLPPVVSELYMAIPQETIDKEKIPFPKYNSSTEYKSYNFQLTPGYLQPVFDNSFNALRTTLSN